MWLVVRFVTNPLLRLSLTVKKLFRRNPLGETESKDEVGTLKDAFNTMSDQIQRSRLDEVSELGKLAACVANEIRNPLAGISSCSQILRKGYGDERGRGELLDLILSDVKRLEEIVCRFLEFAQLSDSEPRRLNIRSIIDDTLSSVEHQAFLQGIVLEKNCTGDDYYIFAQSGQIKRALSYIFANALQAMPDGGSLCVKTGRKGGMIRLEISDTGIGLPECRVEEIFSPFFSARSQGTSVNN
jgi:signal transduction histidine kinase